MSNNQPTLDDLIGAVREAPDFQAMLELTIVILDRATVERPELLESICEELETLRDAITHGLREIDRRSATR